MPFRYTINPYRGCSHACTYCFARPTHEYLGLNGGDDFERRIVVKVNAVERLAAELARPSWSGEHIAMGTNTDPYQQCEGRYRLTRGIVETLGRARNPFSILTKSTMIQRDLDVLVAAAERTDVRVNFSIGTLDEEVWRISEPGTPPPLAPGRGARAPDRGRAPLRRARGADPAGPLRRRGAALARWCAPASRRARSRSRASACTCDPGVRELFMPWLERERPDLVERYDELYGARNGYLARDEQEKLGDRVRALVERHGGCARSPLLSRGFAPAAAPPPKPVETFTQLRLVG